MDTGQHSARAGRPNSLAFTTSVLGIEKFTPAIAKQYSKVFYFISDDCFSSRTTEVLLANRRGAVVLLCSSAKKLFTADWSRIPKSRTRAEELLGRCSQTETYLSSIIAAADEVIATDRETEELAGQVIDKLKLNKVQPKYWQPSLPNLPYPIQKVRQPFLRLGIIITSNNDPDVDLLREVSEFLADTDTLLEVACMTDLSEEMLDLLVAVAPEAHYLFDPTDTEFISFIDRQDCIATDKDIACDVGAAMPYLEAMRRRVMLLTSKNTIKALGLKKPFASPISKGGEWILYSSQLSIEASELLAPQITTTASLASILTRVHSHQKMARK